MQLIQHQKFEPLAVLHHLAINLLEAGKNQLRHHEVREQDVWGIVGDLLPVCRALLAGVTRHGEWSLAL